MNRLQLSFLAALSALPCSLASRPLLAAPPALDYRVPAGCPDSDSFAAAVASRGASLAAGSRPLLVQIEPDSSGFAGSVQVFAEGEPSEPRRVHGASCAEVSDALAVVTAIALQRDAEPSAPAAAAEPAPPADPTPTPPAAAMLAPPVQLVPGWDTFEVPAGKLSLDFISTHTLRGGVQFGAVPGLVMPRYDYSWSRTNVITTPDGRALVHGNELRVRWTLLGLTTRHTPEFDTRVGGFKAGIGGCTPLNYDPTGLTLKVCSEIAAGVMSLVTRDADGNKVQDKGQGLATASAELDAHYNVSKLVHLNLTAGTELWMSRISAERPDGSRLLQSPMFNGYVTIGVGIHF